MKTPNKSTSTFHIFELQLSEDGTIIKKETQGPILSMVIEQQDIIGRFLDENRNIRDIFDLPGKMEGPISQEIKLGHPYPINKRFQYVLYSLNVYSCIPSSFCRFYRTGDSLFASIQYKPTLFGSDISPTVFFDDKENIVALNTPFLDFFGLSFRQPEALFGQNLKKLLNETPAQLTERILAGPAPEVESHQILDLLDTPGPDGLSVNKPECSRRSRGVLEVWSQGPAQNLVSGPREFNFGRSRITLSLRYSAGDGGPPVILFGAPDFSPLTGYTPDSKGFSIGPSADGTVLCLKKAGWLLLATPLPAPGIREHRIELTLCGRQITYKLDGVPILRCDMFDTYWIGAGHAHLLVRPGNRFRITEFKLADEKIVPVQRAVKPLVQFQHLPNRFFSLAFASQYFTSGTTQLIRGIELHEVTTLQEEILSSQAQIRLLKQTREPGALPREGEFLGSGPAVRALLNYAIPIARTEMTAMLKGPTGAGKEVLARYLHANSRRSERPFVKMDCSTIPETLFESLVFGHTRGSFTGAAQDTVGLIESANTGTVFIDEIQNLSMAAQAKLLRVFEDRVVYKVGSNYPVKIDVRFIVGTNKNLEQRIKEGLFREDLFYRVNPATLVLPPLSERREDIPELCVHFVRQYNMEMAARIEPPDPACVEILQSHDWPGNVRELKNVVYHACIFAANNRISAEILRQSLQGKGGAGSGAPGAGFAGGRTGADDADKTVIENALSRHRGNVKRAARELKIARNTLYYHMRKYNLTPAAFRGKRQEGS